MNQKIFNLETGSLIIGNRSGNHLKAFLSRLIRFTYGMQPECNLNREFVYLKTRACN